MRWAVIVFAGCAHAAAPVAPVARPAPGPDLSYTFRVAAGPVIDVTVEAPADASGITNFSVDKFANVDDPETSIRDLHAALDGGGELHVDARPPRSWRVAAPAGSRIALRYTIFSQHPPTMDDRFRTIVTAKLVHFIGTLALAAPSGFGDDKRTIRFTWENLGALHPASSFGTHASETVQETLDLFRASVFLAADDLRITPRAVGDGKLEVATVGAWSFRDGELADRVADIVAMERTFFSDAGAPYFFVSAWPLGEGESYGGTGYTHSFDLTMAPARKLDAELIRTLAHEHFHTWNGEKITPEAFEELTYWFTEGFTDFYAPRLVYRAGLGSLADYVSQVDSDIRAYMTSPVRELPNAKIAGGFWTDEAVTGKIPYYRGHMIALVVDREIRRVSDNRVSLDDVMRALADASDHKITSERVIAMFEGLTSTAFAARVRATAIDGALLAIPDDLFAPCLTGKTVTTWTYDLGFDWDASHKAKHIVGVRAGSAAANAGLRDGDAIRGVNFYSGATDKPVELDVGTPARHIKYFARGKGVEVPEFAVGDAKACESILGGPIHAR